MEWFRTVFCKNAKSYGWLCELAVIWDNFHSQAKYLVSSLGSHKLKSFIPPWLSPILIRILSFGQWCFMWSLINKLLYMRQTLQISFTPSKMLWIMACYMFCIWVSGSPQFDLSFVVVNMNLEFVWMFFSDQTKQYTRTNF